MEFGKVGGGTGHDTWDAYLPELELRLENITFLTQRACFICNEHLWHSSSLRLGCLKRRQSYWNTKSTN